VLKRRDMLAAVACLAAPAQAAGAECASRSRYAGARLHPPPAAAVLERAAAPGGPVRETEAGALVQRLDQAQARMNSVALTAAVGRAGGEIWSRTLGAGPPSPRFFWASMGKAYAATAVLQLVEEGRLALDAPLGRWAPKAPNARWITVEDLLAHTSGLYSFQLDAALRGEPGYKPPERLLDVAYAQPADFCPGASWNYSNTGYVQLGRILEAVEGRPQHEVVAARVVQRLRLEQTTILAPRQVPADLARPVPPDGAPVDGTADDITTPYAAAGVVASAADVVRFWQGLLGGRLHSPSMLRRRFARLYPMFGGDIGFYGLGVMLTDLSAAKGPSSDLWLGHDGGMPGAMATAGYSTARQAYFAVALTGPGSPQATANLLLAALPEARS